MKHWVLEYLVHPPGTITGSILAQLSSCLTLSNTWHLNESQASIRLVSENWPKIPLTQETVSSSFIHPLIEDPTAHFVLNSSFRAFHSLLAPGKTMNGFSLVPSPSAAKHTETFVFS